MSVFLQHKNTVTDPAKCFFTAKDKLFCRKRCEATSAQLNLAGSQAKFHRTTPMSEANIQNLKPRLTLVNLGASPYHLLLPSSLSRADDVTNYDGL